MLTVADDGRGFDPGEASVRSQRLGLTSMEERAAALGARLAISSRAGEGTTVRLRGAGVIRVLIADDHAVVRQGLRTYLELQDGHRGRRGGRRRRRRRSTSRGARRRT